MDSKLSQWCNGLMEVGWLAAIVSIPLFFNIHSDRVFEPDKLTLLRSIALLMATAWLIQFVDQQSWRTWSGWRWRDEESIWRMPFVLPVFLLVVVYLLSTLFSVTPRVSWAGSYQRLQGTYTTLSYIVIFAITIYAMRTKQQINRVITAVIIASIPVSFYGILQHFELDPLPWGGNTSVRVAGHMGNAIFIAAYLIMATPLTIARIINAFTNILSDEELSYADVLRSSVYIFTLCIQLITIYWSGSRGPWLGLGMGLFAFMLIVLVALRNASRAESGRFHLTEALSALGFVVLGMAASYGAVAGLLGGLVTSGRAQSLAGPMSSFAAFVASVVILVVAIFVMIAARRGWRWLWLSWILLAIVLGGWLLLFNLPTEVTANYRENTILGPVIQTLDEWRELPRIGRFGRMLEEDEGTGRVRTLIWEGALTLITPHEPLQFPNGEQDPFNFLRPLFGYGPEAMYVAYNRFYLPELATIEARNASPDRSHNETFDALVITGAAGFLVWQALYLSVFYYGFRWLGVLRTNFERNLLIGLWIGTGGILALVFSLWRGPVYIGVALPFGSIGGLVLYLIYYALFAPTPEEEVQPFEAGRLLMIGLVTAVLAHYVEIHFGIAIASTRLHFFVYVGLMFVMGYWLPRHQAQKQIEPAVTAVPTPSSARKRRPIRTTAEAQTTTGWGPVLLMTIILALMIGITGYDYITYSPPPDKVIDSADDLRPGEVLEQSFFLNSRQDYADSPFIFVMVMLTWSLGIIVGLSEMVKNDELTLSTSPGRLPDKSRQIAGAIFAVMAVASLAYRFIAPAETPGTSTLMGYGLLLIWSGLCALSAVFLFTNRPTAHMVSGIVALIGFLFALPVLFAGQIAVGLLLGLATGGILYLLWDKSFAQLLLPAGVMGFLSMAIGLFYCYVHTTMLLSSLLFRPADVTDPVQLRVLEANQASSFLTIFYAFVIILLFLGATFISSQKMSRVREVGSVPGFASWLVFFVVCLIAVGVTNVRIIQADMIYKRGKPFDDQAGRTRDVVLWDSAIAIYERAIELAPNEDFYYLFLGRAYLERSTLTTDANEQDELLNEAQNRLLRAQVINPLNTDHTANLARLNTRWTELSQTEVDKDERLETAETYYQDALKLSPQNSVIRNEYARLLYALKKDCDSSIDLYTESLEIDPYYANTYFSLGDVYVACAKDLPEQHDAYYQQAAETLQAGLERNDGNVSAWFQLGQIYREMEDYQASLDAFEQTKTLVVSNGRNQIPLWQIDYWRATVYNEMGDKDNALLVAQEAMAAAPENAQPQVQLLIDQINGGVIPEIETGEITPVDGERPLSAMPPATRNNYYTSAPPITIDTSNTYEAIIITAKGQMRLRLFDDEAPLTVNNFVFLAQQGFYDGTTFHRVLADFMAQSGDPTGTGAGGPGYQFADETANGLTFDRPGLLAMANAGPNTNGSQFFITFAPTSWLDGAHTIFGELIEGQNVLDLLTLRDPATNPNFTGDVIERIDIVEITP